MFKLKCLGLREIQGYPKSIRLKPFCRKKKAGSVTFRLVQTCLMTTCLIPEQTYLNCRVKIGIIGNFFQLRLRIFFYSLIIQIKKFNVSFTFEMLSRRVFKKIKAKWLCYQEIWNLRRVWLRRGEMLLNQRKIINLGIFDGKLWIRFLPNLLENSTL